MSHPTPNWGQDHALGWRVHICTTTCDQAIDEAIAREWLQQQECMVLAQPGDPIRSKIAARVRACESVGFLASGPTFWATLTAFYLFSR